jgi:hypothetical protein
MLNYTELMTEDVINSSSPASSPASSLNQFQLSPKKSSAMAWNTILTLRAAAGISSDELDHDDASSDDDDTWLPKTAVGGAVGTADGGAATPPMSPVMSLGTTSKLSPQFIELIQRHLPAPTQEDQQMTLQNLPQSCEAIWRLPGRERVVRLQKFDVEQLEEMLVNVLQWEPEWMQWPEPNWDEKKIRNHVHRIDELHATAEEQREIGAEMVKTRQQQQPSAIRAM